MASIGFSIDFIPEFRYHPAVRRGEEPVDTPFAVLAQMLYGLVREESFRIQHTQWLAVRGQLEPPDALELGGWKQRLAQLKELAAALTELTAQEAQVRTMMRAMVPALGVHPKDEVCPPTFWPGDDSDPCGR
jgi:hypothetical protein